MACFEVSRNLRRDRTVEMHPRHPTGIHLMLLQRNECKLAQLPYQILQGLLSCFGSLKRFTVEERDGHKEIGILPQITHTNTNKHKITKSFVFIEPSYNHPASCQRSNEHCVGFVKLSICLVQMKMLPRTDIFII